MLVFRHNRHGPDKMTGRSSATPNLGAFSHDMARQPTIDEGHGLQQVSARGQLPQLVLFDIHRMVPNMAKLPSKSSPVAAARPNGSGISVVAILRGPAYGLRQPCFLWRYRGRAHPNADWAAIDALMQNCLGVEAGADADSLAGERLVRRLLSWTAALQLNSDLPVFGMGMLLSQQEKEGELLCEAASPYAPGREGVAPKCLRLVTGWAEELMAKKGRAIGAEEAAISKAIDALTPKLRAIAPPGANSLRFLRAAHAREIPWSLISQNIYQFGLGARSRWLDSSFTDRTPTLGAKLARDKSASADALRRIGLPVPDHYLATSADHAVKLAAQLSYPVVVKPADRDGGIAVSANLTDERKVRTAYATASKYSKRVMVQKHVSGRDYRLIVFNGQLVWALERQPAGVMGDGKHTIRQLVELANADPRRGADVRSSLKLLRTTGEAEGLLADLDMTEDSVPAKGMFIPLRSAANISSGGMPVAVNDQVHPDNRRLAQDVATAFRLDLAGIDLLIDDISASWQEIGAHICEVNGQPQLSAATQSHLYGDILQAMVGRGRIPVIAVVGNAFGGTVIQEIQARQLKAKRTIGLAAAAGAWIKGKKVMAGPDVYTAVQMLLSHPEVEVALVLINEGSLLKTGFPTDRIDYLIVGDDIAQPAAPMLLRRIVHMLAPNSRCVLVNQDVNACLAATSLVARAKVKPVPGNAKAIASLVDKIIGEASGPVKRTKA